MGASNSSLVEFSSRSGSSPEPSRLPKVPQWLDESEEERVYLYVYDMTNGLSPAFSSLFSKFDFEALWHTSIVVFNREYSFGQEQGIQVGDPGKPTRKVDLGCTHVSRRTLYEGLVCLKNNIYNESSYDVFFRNCNSFSESICQLLTGQSIPYEYRTFGQRMFDLCLQHYNIRSQDELFEFVRLM